MTTVAPLTLAVIEDQNLFRDTIVAALADRLGARTVATYSDAETAIRCARQMAEVQVALVDLRLGRDDAFNLVEVLKLECPALRMIWMTSAEEDYLIHRAQELGLPGFVHKGDSMDVLVTAVEVVAGGGRYYSEKVSSLIRQQRSREDHFSLVLSAREQEVLRHIGAGFTNEETAAIMGLSAWTIQTHRRNIMARLELHSAVEVVAYAMRHGFVGPHSLPDRGVRHDQAAEA